MPVSRPRVLVVGNTTIDHVFTFDRQPAADEKLQATSYAACAGGQAANVAATLAMLGLEVVFVGPFGDDAGAVESLRAFAAIGVDTRWAPRVADCRHHVASILVAGDRRSIAMYRDPRLTLDGFRFPEAALEGCAAVYTDGHEIAASLELARIATGRTIPLVMDIETATSATRRLAGSAGHLIAPADILCRLTGRDTVADALHAAAASGPVAVVATLGAQGASGLCAGDDAAIDVPATPCAVVDTTGAGDAFHAGYLAALLGGLPFRERLVLAADVAAIKCGMRGPRIAADACAQAGISWSAPP
jgi:sugar/nucleoside kinase (ribokinase family)